jgi:ATP-dependent RNA helicase DDX49/DBP8
MLIVQKRKTRLKLSFVTFYQKKKKKKKNHRSRFFFLISNKMAESRTLSRVSSSKKASTQPQKPKIASEGTSFNSLGVDQWLCDTLKVMAIRQPTEIQRACIPPILAGKDVIGGAKTGSGKTAAFALPILQTLSEDPYGVFALVLTPTR